MEGCWTGNITCSGEGLRNRTCSLAFYVPWMPGTILWRRIIDDHSKAWFTQAWVKEQKRTAGKAQFVGIKTMYLHVLTCVYMYLITYLYLCSCFLVQTCANTLVEGILKTSRTALPSCDLMVTLCWRSAKAISAWSKTPRWINDLEQSRNIQQTLKEWLNMLKSQNNTHAQKTRRLNFDFHDSEKSKASHAVSKSWTWGHDTTLMRSADPGTIFAAPVILHV